jgi:hypothetical protein
MDCLVVGGWHSFEERRGGDKVPMHDRGRSTADRSGDLRRAQCLVPLDRGQQADKMTVEQFLGGVALEANVGRDGDRAAVRVVARALERRQG